MKKKQSSRIFKNNALRRACYLAVAVVCVLFAQKPTPLFAYELPPYIHVGLTYRYQNTTAIPIENRTVAAGFESGGAFAAQTVLSAATGFSVRCADAYYAVSGQVYGDYESAQDAAAAFAKATPCLIGESVFAVYVGGYASEAEAVAQAALLPTPGRVAAGGAAVMLTDGVTPALLFDNPDCAAQLADPNGAPMDLSDRLFRGRIAFPRVGGGLITAVNILTADEYLYSAVPSEMPSGWPAEALKSQACAARNYALKNSAKHANEGFGLCDGIHCQVYLGVGNEADSTTQAVNDTSGQLILYQNEPIDAVFFSSSGGATDDAVNVWANDLPYLKSVKELNEPMAKQWERVIPLDALNGVLAANGAAIGDAVGMQIGAYNNAGRVAELVITGTLGSLTLHKEQIRTYFSSLPGGSLESRQFALTAGAVAGAALSDLFLLDAAAAVPAPESLTVADGTGASFVLPNGQSVAVAGANGSATYTKDPAPAQTNTDVITITGKGWGHGVGMSQYGAKGMAEQGYTYDQILKHYYTGVEVR